MSKFKKTLKKIFPSSAGTKSVYDIGSPGSGIQRSVEFYKSVYPGISDEEAEIIQKKLNDPDDQSCVL